MYEILKLHYDILQFYINENDYENIINCVFKYGSNDTNMWIQVLTYFANCKEECQKEITKLLNRIEKDDILPPLLVIQILSNHKKTQLGTIKDYVEKKLEKEQILINEGLIIFFL